jgi:hypothetical protein
VGPIPAKVVSTKQRLTKRVASSLFHRLLRVKVMEVLDTSMRNLASGNCRDYGAYKEEVGYCRGLKDALTYAEDVEREPDERSDTA